MIDLWRGGHFVCLDDETLEVFLMRFSNSRNVTISVKPSSMPVIKKAEVTTDLDTGGGIIKHGTLRLLSGNRC